MNCIKRVTSSGREYRVIDLPASAGADLNRLPHIHRILLENVLRRAGDDAPRCESAILGWLRTASSSEEIPFFPGRVLMHDTTCGPALVDIAAMRSALSERGIDPARLNAVVPVDISTDHSVAVDMFGTPDALQKNMEREFERNSERYQLMKWATSSLAHVRAHPPGTGIMHTLNLEQLSSVIAAEEVDAALWAMPDTMIGTDSHTPMVNGIGVLGWGVGGLEAESALVGMPVMIRVPDVIGVRLTGVLREGVLATDLALAVTERLRQFDLADKYVEFFGAGVSSLSAGDRAVVANMAPEFGGNSGYFPIDPQVIQYLLETGRSAKQIDLVENYAKAQGLWFEPKAEPRFTEIVEIDLSKVEVSVAGPQRPQDRISAGATRTALDRILSAPRTIQLPNQPGDGSVAIAAITSCTNTSEPRLLIAAGLLARKARAAGLRPPAWVKTSLAPGSPTAERYLMRAGLLEDLQALGFGIVGYGCTTCIGNSGPLTEPIEQAINERDATPVAVLSGNRNFPGRVHPKLIAGFLASPPMVIAFALAGDVNRNILTEPIGKSFTGAEIHLSDIWPTGAEIDAALGAAHSTGDYALSYAQAEASETWKELNAPTDPLFPWDPNSTYIRRPPFAAFSTSSRLGLYTAHPLAVFGDDVTTDHISPAGQIAKNSDAAQWLIEHGADGADLNVYAARRGNWEVMLRGLFMNKSVRNLLGSEIPAGFTIHANSGECLPIWRAAQRYENEGASVVIVAGHRYGMGSSRDWAAKGAALLGVRAVLASSFERIHRSNLINMGILPLKLPVEQNPKTLALKAGDQVEVSALAERLSPRVGVGIQITRQAGENQAFTATAALETSLEVETLKAGGLLPMILRNIASRA